MRKLFRFTLLALLLTGHAAAQQVTISAADQPAWNAVGRLNKGGIASLSTCSAALVAPDLVLTAAHCVASARNDDPDTLEPYIFVAGWNRGDYAAASGISAVLRPPDHIAGPLTETAIAADVALVRLSDPIRDVTPLPLSNGPVPSTAGFVGYANSRLHAPAVSQDCLTVTRRDRVHYMGCPVEAGNSGAPVLAGLPDAPAIVGTVSARRGFGALIAALHPWVVETLGAN